MNYTACNYEDAFKAKDITSSLMKSAITEWYHLFYDAKPDKMGDPAQRIPYTIVSKLSKTMFSEYEATSTDPFISGCLDNLKNRQALAAQRFISFGEAFIKPYPSGNSMEFSVIGRNGFLVFGRDAQGRPTDIGTAERTTQGSKYYTLLERRTIGQDNKLTIKNMLYQSADESSIGSRVPLTALDRYASILDEYTFPEPIGLGLAYLRCPVQNPVDDSTDGVSVYAAATGLIRHVNTNELQFAGEFERGQSRIIVPDDMLRYMDEDGKFKKRLADNVFTAIGDSDDGAGITIFNPTLRTTEFLARENSILRKIENTIGLKRGLLSEVEAQERTAKEITSSEGDYSLSIIEFQHVWERAVKELAVICGRLGRMYGLAGARDVVPDAVTVDWGNGILYDEEKAWNDYKDMVSRGLIKPEIAVGWRFNMPTETEADLAAVRKKYMPVLDTLMQGEE